MIFNYGTITLLGRAFQHIRLSNNFVTSLIINYDVPALQPHSTILICMIAHTNKDRRVVWASSLSLAATHEILISFYSSRY